MLAHVDARSVTLQFLHSRLYENGLRTLVGDEVWERMSAPQQLKLAEHRGEYLYFRHQENFVEPLGGGAGASNPEGFLVRPLNAQQISNHLYQMLEDRRPSRLAMAETVVANVCVCIDFCKSTGRDLSFAWNCVVTNEHNELLGQIGCDTTKLADLELWFKALGQRPGMGAPDGFKFVGVIDNVPPSKDPDFLSNLERMLMACFRLDRVVQDRFHVSHNLTKGAVNNFDSRYWHFIIKRFRDLTTCEEEGPAAVVRTAFLNGQIKKSVTFRDVTLTVTKGVKNSQETLDEWVARGHWFEAFCTQNTVIPTNIIPAEALPNALDRWESEVRSACFDENDAPKAAWNGVKKSHLFVNLDSLRSMKQNALKRLMKCTIPRNEGYVPWSATGEKDFNDFPIFKSNYHTCGVESLNAQQPAYVNSLRTHRPERAAAAHYEGNAAHFVKKAIKRKAMEPMGVTDLRCAQRINALAGYDVDGNTTNEPPLVAGPPLKLPCFAPSCSVAATYVRDVSTGGFDEAAPRKLVRCPDASGQCIHADRSLPLCVLRRSLDCAKEPRYSPMLPLTSGSQRQRLLTSSPAAFQPLPSPSRSMLQMDFLPSCSAVAGSAPKRAEPATPERDGSIDLTSCSPASGRSPKVPRPFW